MTSVATLDVLKALESKNSGRARKVVWREKRKKEKKGGKRKKKRWQTPPKHHQRYLIIVSVAIALWTSAIVSIGPDAAEAGFFPKELPNNLSAAINHSMLTAIPFTQSLQCTVA